MTPERLARSPRRNQARAGEIEWEDMTKQELLDFSADHIGKPWTMEDHQRLVVGLRAVEQMAANHIRRALDEVENRRGASYHHSPVDPEAAEI